MCETRREIGENHQKFQDILSRLPRTISQQKKVWVHIARYFQISDNQRERKKDYFNDGILIRSRSRDNRLAYASFWDDKTLRSARSIDFEDKKCFIIQFIVSQADSVSQSTIFEEKIALHNALAFYIED